MDIKRFAINADHRYYSRLLMSRSLNNKLSAEPVIRSIIHLQTDNIKTESLPVISGTAIRCNERKRLGLLGDTFVLKTQRHNCIPTFRICCGQMQSVWSANNVKQGKMMSASLAVIVVIAHRIIQYPHCTKSRSFDMPPDVILQISQNMHLCTTKRIVTRIIAALCYEIINYNGNPTRFILI